MKEVEKYYSVRYVNSTKVKVIKTTKVLKAGMYYFDNNGNQLEILRQTHLKYTIQDLKDVYSILSEYSVGSFQNIIANKLYRVIMSDIPIIRLSTEERDVIRITMYERDDIQENILKSFKKMCVQ